MCCTQYTTTSNGSQKYTTTNEFDCDYYNDTTEYTIMYTCLYTLYNGICTVCCM